MPVSRAVDDGGACRRVALAVLVAVVTACGGSGWAEVDEVLATSPDAVQLSLVLDYCDASRNPLVIDDAVESADEVRVRLDIPIPNGDRDDCRGYAVVQLTSAIGDRTVVNDRTGERHTVGFSSAGPPTTTGSTSSGG